MTQQLIVKVTCGTEAPERLSQGITVAATAAASGINVSLWLTGDAVWLGVPGRIPDLGLDHSTPLSSLVEGLLETAQITVCTQCAQRRGIGPDDVEIGVRISGAATFVSEVMVENAKALVY
jgi:predicted peroxiredoxin